MNRTTLCTLWLAGFALATAGCSQPGPATSGGNGGAPSSGGDTSSGGSTVTASGGATTSLGGATTTSLGGETTTSSGGSSASGTGGATTTSSGGRSTAGAGGATTNAGGAPASGGVVRSGGATTSAGGATTAGGATAAGGAAKTGGATTSSGGATTASGGATSSGGTTGGTIDPTTIVPDLVGYMWIGTCSNGSLSGLDCPLLPTGTAACPNQTSTDYNTQGLFRTTTFNIKGTTGTQYTVNFEARGVLGTRCYTGGKPQVATLSTNPEVSNDGWYVGGQPVAPSLWNTYEIHVSPAVPGSGAPNPLKAGEDVYFMNAFPYPPPIPYGSDTYCEAHETFPMKYTASFKVMGGGTISLVLHDSNCLGQMNCGGPNRQSVCANSRTVDLTGMSPPPANFTQPYKQSNGFLPQWVYFGNLTATSP